MELQFRKATVNDVEQLVRLRKRQSVDEGIAPNIEIDAELSAFFEKN